MTADSADGAFWSHTKQHSSKTILVLHHQQI